MFIFAIILDFFCFFFFEFTDRAGAGHIHRILRNVIEAAPFVKEPGLNVLLRNEMKQTGVIDPTGATEEMCQQMEQRSLKILSRIKELGSQPEGREMVGDGMASWELLVAANGQLGFQLMSPSSTQNITPVNDMSSSFIELVTGRVNPNLTSRDPNILSHVSPSFRLASVSEGADDIFWSSEFGNYAWGGFGSGVGGNPM